MPGQVCCMVMKISLDCNGCCRKMRRIILRMKEIETHSIEKQHSRVIVCGRFVPADIAIKIRKKMKRRVEILEIEGLSSGSDGHTEQGPAPTHVPDHTIPMPHLQVPDPHAIAQHA
ncbi:heavy metal-associated isoprenylated plant protein 19 [Coffea arabica]|uniref:Heavy metal-associated isoprenylated plant protein 19 n=1 Tax=Coffea arabica TaxID=13443 RepID=A0A6P6VAV2_COFAR